MTTTGLARGPESAQRMRSLSGSTQQGWYGQGRRFGWLCCGLPSQELA